MNVRQAQLPKGWELKKLRDVILEIKDGGTPSRTKPEYFGGDVSWCVVKDISPEIYSTRENLTELGLSKCSAKEWPINSVIISLGATIGQVGIAKIPVATKQGISGIIVNQTLLKPELLVYYLNFQKDFIQRAATGATIKEVRPSKLADILDFPLPPISEQQRIVSILDEAFAAIAKAKTNAKQNLKNAKELFESYLQGVFENKGEGWEEKTLGVVYDVRDGTHDSPKYQEEGFPLITSKNLKKDLLNYDNVNYISEQDYININKRSKVDKGDILFAMIGTIGNPVVIQDEPDFAIKNVALFKVPKEQNSYFLKYYLDAKSTIDKMMGDAKGTTQKFVGLGYLRGFKILMPPIKEQQNIVQKLDALSTETKKLEAIYQQKINDLEDLKKSVLQKAFSGELKTEKELV